jgi:hypothetical protein
MSWLTTLLAHSCLPGCTSSFLAPLPLPLPYPHPPPLPPPLCHPTTTLLRHGLPCLCYGWLPHHLIVYIEALTSVAALLLSASSPIVWVAASLSAPSSIICVVVGCWHQGIIVHLQHRGVVVCVVVHRLHCGSIVCGCIVVVVCIAVVLLLVAALFLLKEVYISCNYNHKLS